MPGQVGGGGQVGLRAEALRCSLGTLMHFVPGSKAESFGFGGSSRKAVWFGEGSWKLPTARATGPEAVARKQPDRQGPSCQVLCLELRSKVAPWGVKVACQAPGVFLLMLQTPQSRGRQGQEAAD